MPLREKAAKQHYSIPDVQLFLKLVLEGGCGLRTVSRVLSVIGKFFGLPTDVASWYSGRLWLDAGGFVQTPISPKPRGNSPGRKKGYSPGRRVPRNVIYKGGSPPKKVA